MSTDTGPLPHRPPVEAPEGDTRVVQFGGTETAELCGLLSSETATDILDAVGGEPMTASEVAEAVGTSVQNVTYHLSRLRDAELVRVVDTWYSSRGREMQVYALACETVVLSVDPDAHEGGPGTDAGPSEAAPPGAD
jgi:DNA-binding transcriptional ArsR family regulator